MTLNIHEERVFQKGVVCTKKLSRIAKWQSKMDNPENTGIKGYTRHKSKTKKTKHHFTQTNTNNVKKT